MRGSKKSVRIGGRMPKKPKIKQQIHTSSIVLLLVFFVAGTSHAAEINLGANLGFRQLKDANLNSIYGNGFVYNLFVRYFPLEKYGIEFSYEGGYKKNALIGLYQEHSTLSVKEVQLAGVFRYPVWRLNPYFKFGVGYFSYQQDIESEFVLFKVNHNKWTTVVGGGVTYTLFGGLFLSAEANYVPLEVQPFDIPVDLGGMRYLFGLGFHLPL
jgi:hypothetical protein